MQIRSFAGSRLGLGWPSASVVLANEPAQNQPQQSSSTCSLIAALKTTPAFALARHLQQFFNEAGCFEFVEGLDGLAKAILCQTLDLGFLQLVLLDDLEDEVFLFIGAIPVTILGGLVLVVPVASVAVTALTATLTIAVAVCGEITGFLDTGIDALLEQFIQPGAFGLHLIEVGDFGSEGDGEQIGRASCRER